MAQDKNALKNQALTQRIATLVAQYEDQLADTRAEATIVIEAQTARVQELENENAQLKAQLQGDVDEVPEEEAPASEQE